MARRATERGAVAPASLLAGALVVVAIGTAGYAITSGPEQHAKNTPVSTQTTPTPMTSPSAKPTHKTTARVSPSPSATPTTVAISRSTFNVGVYNNSTISGLAARTAAKVTGFGWKVITTSQWAGAISTTTVYYPPAMKLAAEQLAKDLGITSIKPAVQPMPMSQLTLILTSDYRG